MKVIAEKVFISANSAVIVIQVTIESIESCPVRTSRVFKVSVPVVVGTFLLVGCDRNLSISPEAGDPGSLISVGPNYCVDSEGDPVEGTTTTVFIPYTFDINAVVENLDDLVEIIDGPTTDSQGAWEVQFSAPDTPGEYIVIANLFGGECDGAELFSVNQPEIGLTLSASEIEEGDEVTASATWCQNEHDFYDDEFKGEPPVMEFLVDGDVMDTISADEVGPTGTVETVLDFDSNGHHEVTAQCAYQKVTIDFDTLTQSDDYLDGVTSARAHLTDRVDVTVLGDSNDETPVPTDNPSDDPEDGTKTTPTSSPGEISAKPARVEPSYAG